MNITVIEATSTTPKRIFKEGLNFTLEFVKVEELAGLEVYKPAEQDVLIEYCFFAIEIVKKRNQFFYITSDDGSLYFVTNKTTASELEKILGVRR